MIEQAKFTYYHLGKAFKKRKKQFKNKEENKQIQSDKSSEFN